MTKQQLIEKVAAKTELKKAEVEVAVDSVLELIAEALRSNERVDIRGFGSFVVKERKERQGRNPRTGETITIPAKRDASFKPGTGISPAGFLVPARVPQWRFLGPAAAADPQRRSRPFPDHHLRSGHG